MLFDTPHILYMVISTLITIGLLIVFGLKIKKYEHKKIILKIFAVLTVVLHFSSLWVDFFAQGSAAIESPMLLPIYPCNVMMWLLLICAFLKRKENIAYKILLEFTALAGIVCAFVGIAFNANYGATPNLLDWDILKGLLSHSTLMFGCLYLIVSGFVKIRVFNTFSIFCGLCLLLIDGGIINGLYAVFNLPPCNSMYLLEPPFAGAPWLNTFMIGVIALILIFVIGVLYEQFALKREERWYSVIRRKFSKHEIEEKIEQAEEKTEGEIK